MVSKNVPMGADQAKVDSVTAMREIMLMAFKQDEVYLGYTGTSSNAVTVAAEGDSVNVFLNPMWKPSRDDFTGENAAADYKLANDGI